MARNTNDLQRLLVDVRACRICRDTPTAKHPLPQEPRPILRVSHHARLAVFSQAPGLRAHTADLPFMDPSGVRLRAWMQLSEADSYDEDFLAIAPMGFCFPGYDAKGGDLPPRRECAPVWRERVLTHLPNVKLALLVGGYSQKWHLRSLAGRNLTETVRDWKRIISNTDERGLTYLPMPHPSWRNNHWLKKNPWFEGELLPELRNRIAHLLRDHKARRTAQTLKPKRQLRGDPTYAAARASPAVVSP
ncbi:MAG: uracil-DNA glycosylase family protein [Pseudomonadota bacterium]